MGYSRLLLIGLFLIVYGGKILPVFAQLDFIKKPNSDTPVCPPPALERVQRHRVIEGENIERIAIYHNLTPETLIRFNPSLQTGTVSPGQELLIPPFNGIRVDVPAGATWKDLEDVYGVRADVLFEVNGCQMKPTAVFIPGVNWTARQQKGQDYTGLSGYPLPFLAEVGLKYGWQENPTNQRRLFHSGVDLLAPVGTAVLAAASGTVVYVGQEEGYGFMVIINHGDVRQTRYAHLSRVTAKIGQPVNTGDVIGAVGTTGQPDLDVPHLHFEVRYKFPVGWVAQDPEINLTQESPAASP
ncbi:Peptidase M23 [Gloeothece citriformis PCC 7424]|uniref:Peptidase M23 n=1 Tax=Gloeothece citriformis (strain PCC 7424) TaxID=65393 RepID=B7KAT3_GLOC7|nr:M23 family metallopeptidase [Gloeothece citriformis]ACK68755.1 Peptidase M23 [Gloeothece citriformis PCC 7424]